MVLQLGEQFLKLFGIVMDFALERPALHGVAHGGAHRADIERFVDIIACPQPQRLPHRIGRLKCRHHHRFD